MRSSRPACSSARFAVCSHQRRMPPKSLDLQRDALLAKGIDDAAHPYHDVTSGVRADRL